MLEPRPSSLLAKFSSEARKSRPLPPTHPPGFFHLGPDRLHQPFFSQARLPPPVQPHPLLLASTAVASTSECALPQA